MERERDCCPRCESADKRVFILRRTSRGLLLNYESCHSTDYYNWHDPLPANPLFIEVICHRHEGQAHAALAEPRKCSCFIMAGNRDVKCPQHGDAVAHREARQDAPYWEARAKEAELKVLTFLEGIAELRARESAGQAERAELQSELDIWTKKVAHLLVEASRWQAEQEQLWKIAKLAHEWSMKFALVSQPSKGDITIAHELYAACEALLASGPQPIPGPAKLPIDRSCSVCGDGDTEMEHHDHNPPFRKGYGPQPIPEEKS